MRGPWTECLWRHEDLTVLTRPGNDEERLIFGCFLEHLIVFNYSICGPVSLLYHQKEAIHFSEETGNHCSSLYPSSTWKMSKLPSSHLCVFEGTALTSVGFLHRCMADCEDKFELQSELHGNMILACLQLTRHREGVRTVFAGWWQNGSAPHVHLEKPWH